MVADVVDSGRKTMASFLRDRVGSDFQAYDDGGIAASFNLDDALEGIFYTKLIHSLNIKLAFDLFLVKLLQSGRAFNLNRKGKRRQKTSPKMLPTSI